MSMARTTTPARNRGIDNDAFNDEWRRQLREKTATPAQSKQTPAHPSPHLSRTPRLTLTKSRPTAFLTGSPGVYSLYNRVRCTNRVQAPARSKKAAARQWEDQNANFEPEGGLSAHDICADRSLVLSHARQSGARFASAHDVRYLCLSCPLDGDCCPDQSIDIQEVVEPERNDVAAKKKRKKEKKKSKAATKDTEDESDASDAEQSKKIKAELLPKWSKPRVKQRVVPSLCQFLGIQDNSWSLDTEEYKFLELVQVVLNDVFPERHHQLTKKDIIYRWVRHCMYVFS